ncbi:hypothetical protein PACTADRAFT_4316 [Pachysolen tannophilus NRRL Y-2460]|uniref:Peroxisomal-coenzyme A synthetase n=1 Tax=Pachysolen tannophilus NRRL Y-2460 TaxID=669874 RepID=A0A1E4TRL9_PACTA|nr:hypothetical protein PACTADRAFT_4316 [Pachysolen tannophilus NRRL Y-2460]
MSTFTNSIALSSNDAVVVPNGPSITYRHLSSIVGHLQTFLNNPTSPLYKTALPQNAIAISLPNGLEFVSVFLAITTAARIAAPLNPAYKKSELDFYLGDLNARAIIVSKGVVTQNLNNELLLSAKENKVKLIEVWYDDQRKRVEYEIFDENSLKSLYKSLNQPVLINYSSLIPGTAKSGDIALIIHTSGTTGRPKAVPLTHKNITKSMANISKTFKLTSADKTYLVMPLFHVHGLIGALLSTLSTGGTAIIPPRFSAKVFWSDFVKYGANWYTAVPTIHLILLNVAKPDPLPKLRFIRSCSSALAPDTFSQLEKVFHAPVIESYGSSESSHCMTANNLPPGDRRPGTVGVGQGVEVAILDDAGNKLSPGSIGEVGVRGENIMNGYLNNEKANKESFTSDGFFRTGDQGYQDKKDGFLTLTGRIKELINRGGEKISPIELDGVMHSHPEVSEAVAFGVPDKKYGEAVNAAVVLKAGSHLTEKELQAWLSDKLAKMKVPEKIFITDKLPKTATGKIQRRIIAKVFTSKSKL